MKFLYKGEVKKKRPSKKYHRTFSVDCEDIFLVFVNCEIRGRSIFSNYEIKYFDTPVPVTSSKFDTLINKNSLRKAVLDNIQEDKELLTIKKLDTKILVLEFNIEKFLKRSTLPVPNVTKKEGDGKYHLILNKDIPNTILHNCGFEVEKMFEKEMIRLLINDKRYSKIFRNSFSNDFIFSRRDPFKYFDILFNIDDNSFEINIKNTLIYMLYYEPSR